MARYCRASLDFGRGKEGQLMKVHHFYKDEISIAGVKAITIARLLEEYANSEGEGVLPSSKRQAWNIAQDLRKEAN